MTRAAAAAVDIFARATGTAGTGIDDRGRDEGDNDCDSSVLELLSGILRMSKVK